MGTRPTPEFGVNYGEPGQVGAPKAARTMAADRSSGYLIPFLKSHIIILLGPLLTH
jgi:hypothetical protein